MKKKFLHHTALALVFSTSLLKGQNLDEQIEKTQYLLQGIWQNEDNSDEIIMFEKNEEKSSRDRGKSWVDKQTFKVSNKCLNESNIDDEIDQTINNIYFSYIEDDICYSIENLDSNKLVLLYSNMGREVYHTYIKIKEIISLSENEVLIGNQIWMNENLKEIKFRNGDLIKEAKTYEEWENAGYKGIPMWKKCSNREKYGILYNRHAIFDPRGLAPEGWEIPSKEDWENLINHFEDRGKIPAYELKFDEYWDEDNYGVNGNNNSKFSAMPAGVVEQDGTCMGGSFSNMWSSSIDDYNNPFYLNITSNSEDSDTNIFTMERYEGYSVRCIKKSR